MADLRRNVLHGFGAPSSTPSAQNNVLSASTHRIAWAFQVPAADTLTHAGFRYGARTGIPPTWRISLQGLDASGNPDGTIKGGASPASATFTPPADTTWDGTWQWVALDNSYAAARGEFLAAVIDYSAGTVDAANSSSFTRGYSNTGLHIFPYALVDTTGAYAKQAERAVFGAKGAGVYGWPLESLYATAIGVNGNRAALKFSLPAGAGTSFKVVGARLLQANPAAANTWKLGLWDAAGAVIQDVTVDSDHSSGTAAAWRYYEHYFDESSLAALSYGTTYYLGVERVAAALTPNGWVVDGAADLAALPGGGDFGAATWNGSAWADVAGAVLAVEPILDDATAAAGGGAALGAYVETTSNQWW